MTSILDSVLREADEVVVRDSASHQRSEMVASDATKQLPDLAFALADGVGPVPRSSVCALVPRLPLVHSTAAAREAVVAGFADLARRLLNDGYVERVELIPQVVGPSTTEDDRHACQAVCERVSDDRVVVVEGPSGDSWSPRELVAYFGKVAFVVSVRLHGAILSMCAGTPAFAISYFTGKTEGVMTSVGMPDSWTALDEFSSEQVVAWLTSVPLHERSQNLIQAVKSARDQLADHGFRMGA